MSAHGAMRRCAGAPVCRCASLIAPYAGEVLSPKTAHLDRVRKQRIYAREKVSYLWLVDPIGRTLEIFEQSGDLWRVIGAHGGGEKVRAKPFEAIELSLSRWWEDESPEDL